MRLFYLMLNIFLFYIHFTESKFLRDTEWLMKSFEEGFRLQSVLITAPDVLQPRVLRKVTIASNRIVLRYS